MAIADEVRRARWPVVPSVSTIHRVLVRNGLVVAAPQKRPRSSWRRFRCAWPNGCWQIDATCWELAGGTPAAIMNVVDDHSRLLIATLAAPGQTVAAAITAITTGGQSWGLPQQVLSDNGSCFGGVDKTGDLPDLLAWLGVRLVHARVYHPQTMGKVERFHQTLKGWLATQPRAGALAELQAQLDDFAVYYNTRRPHRALHGATPAEAWQATPAAGPAEHPLPTTARISVHHPTVTTTGVLTVGRSRIGLGTTWAGHRLTAIRYGTHILVLDHTHPIRAVSTTPTQRYYGQGAARHHGQGPAPPAPPPDGAAEVSGVQGGRRPSRSDATGALDTGGAAPHTARRPGPPTNHPQTHQLSPMS
jgi:transposase InsO family protein